MASVIAIRRLVVKTAVGSTLARLRKVEKKRYTNQTGPRENEEEWPFNRLRAGSEGERPGRSAGSPGSGDVADEAMRCGSRARRLNEAMQGRI